MRRRDLTFPSHVNARATEDGLGRDGSPLQLAVRPVLLTHCVTIRAGAIGAMAARYARQGCITIVLDLAGLLTRLPAVHICGLRRGLSAATASVDDVIGEVHGCRIERDCETDSSGCTGRSQYPITALLTPQPPAVDPGDRVGAVRVRRQAGAAGGCRRRRPSRWHSQPSVPSPIGTNSPGGSRQSRRFRFAPASAAS